MNEEHEDKGVGNEDNAEVAEANKDKHKVFEATEDKEKETVPEDKGGGDKRDGEGIAELSSAGNPSHGEGVMEPNGDGDGDAGKMENGSPHPRPMRKLSVPTKTKARGNWMNPWKRESKEEGQSPHRMSTTSPPPQVTQVWPWRKRGRAMRHPRRNRRTRRVWMQRKSYEAHQLCND